jgi:phage tail sheath protein FI
LVIGTSGVIRQMRTYLPPGVYFEWLDTRSPSIAPLRTDIAGFVGIAARGPLHEPVKVASWTQFTSVFGRHTPQGYLAYAVEGFFANGGQLCWVVRAADPATAESARLTIVDRAGWPLVTLVAASEGTWASTLSVTAIEAGDQRITLALRVQDGAREIWSNLSLTPSRSRYILDTLNDPVDGSSLVDAVAPTGFPPVGRERLVVGSTTRMRGGSDGLATLQPGHLSGVGGPVDKRWGLAALETKDDVSIVAMPDIMLPPPSIMPTPPPAPEPDCGKLDDVSDAQYLLSGQPRTDVFIDPPEFATPFDADQILSLQRELVAHCERLRDRVAILDSAPFDLTPELAGARRDAIQSRFAALYFPWIRVADPLRLDGLVRDVPPSAHLAGLYARGDLATGVHKPPANEPVEGARDVVRIVDDVEHGELNQRSVNVIRPYSGLGLRVMGARTLAERDDREWRYINVRRLLIMIEEAIEEQTQWAVFEPNNQALWRDLDRAARGFLDDLWRRGMLDGATALDAYSVTCDETTNPPDERALGRVICVIGVQPPYPAEFVIVRIGKTEFGTEILETGVTSRA